MSTKNIKEEIELPRNRERSLPSPAEAIETLRDPISTTRLLDERKTIFWTNHKILDHKKLVTIKNHLLKIVPTFLPLMSNDKAKLQSYADELGVSFEELASYRNNLKIQQEIQASHNADQIKSKINDFVKALSKSIGSKNLTEQKVKTIIAHKIRTTKLSLSSVLKLIRKSPYYLTLPEYVGKYLENYDRLLKNDNSARAERAGQFEIQLENFLTKVDIPFQTEQQLIESGSANTPDILLDEPIKIVITGTDGKQSIHTVKWLDAKNFMLADIPFMLASLKKQGKKYVDAYGPGAFVFRHGFDSSLVTKFNLDNILILDGSEI
jgi:hypothetical protein